MRTQETTGKVKHVQGRVKEAVGILTGDKKLEREGSVQRAEGTVEETLGKARRKVGEALKNLGDAVRK